MITVTDIRKTYIDAAGMTPAARRQAELMFDETLRKYVQTQHVEQCGATNVEPPAGYHGDPLWLHDTDPQDWTDDTHDTEPDKDINLPETPAASKWENELDDALTLICGAKELVKQAVCDCDVEDYLFLFANAANQLQVVEETLNAARGE